MPSKKGLNPTKPPPIPCCNGPSCKSPEPGFLRREPFIEQAIVTKYTEADREWMACRIAALEKWRKETSRRLWLLQEGMDLELNLALTDTCMLALAKSGELLQDQASLVEILKRSHTKAEYAEEILECL